MDDEEGKQDVIAELKPFFRLFKDGSVQRIDPHLLTPPHPPVHGVSSTDLTFLADLGLWARLHFPTSLLPPPRRLPIVLNFHGGGFIYGGPATNRHFCSLMVQHSPSIWISPLYRLAPEHRLPAAFDDGIAALRWLHSQARLQANGEHDRLDHPVFAQADFSKFFLAGSSTGGLLAHQVAIRALNDLPSSSPWGPLCIRGLILIHPSFLRTIRSQKEMESPPHLRMNEHVVDLVMGLVLPPEASRDHPFLNPLLGLAAMADRQLVLPKTLVCMADGDPLQFVEMEYVQALQKAGCQVESIMSSGVGHLFYISQPDSEQAQALRSKIASFIMEE